MTRSPIHPDPHRKDLGTLISHQTDIPCAVGGYAAESVVAFLMRLYAYFHAKFSDEIAAEYAPFSYVPDSAEGFKTRLMTTGPYQVNLVITDFDARPNALMLRTVPLSTAQYGWVILWPGASLDIYFKTGRNAPAFHKAMPTYFTVNRRVDGTSVISTTGGMIPNGGYRFAPSVLQIGQRPIRLIPP